MKFLRSNAGMEANQAAKILVDTSVIIDGRIADIARAGFVPGTLLVPRFVLAELQNIADSSDAMRRSRGRRGLEMLNNIRVTEDVDMEVIDDDVENVQEVDAKLVALARKLGASILTTDYNLNRVAQIEGVRVLNINELANAIRPVILPGERMLVKIVQSGKEKGQGVGYLADGTMIVVDQGDKMMGQDVESEITRVFQTVAGKMLFAVPVNYSKSGGQKPTPKPASQEHKLDQKVTDQKHPRKPGQNNRSNFKSNNEAPRSQTRPSHQPVKSEGKKPNAHSKRKNPTQRLEDSLIELTGGQ
jgi:rRNA maturation endonuclease Nob1